MANTWNHHLREADEDEKVAIRFAGRSEAFRAFLNAPGGSLGSEPGPLIGTKRPAEDERDPCLSSSQRAHHVCF